MCCSFWVIWNFLFFSYRCLSYTQTYTKHHNVLLWDTIKISKQNFELEFIIFCSLKDLEHLKKCHKFLHFKIIKSEIKMLKHSSRSRMNSVKKKALEKSVLQDMNFLSLKEFYNSIPGVFKEILMQSKIIFLKFFQTIVTSIIFQNVNFIVN